MKEVKAKLQKWLEKARGDAGISLAETIVALALFAAGALPIAGTSVELGAVMTSVHVRSRALAVAEHRLEEIYRQPYLTIADGTAIDGDVTLQWDVTEGLLSKQVVLTYQYYVRDVVRQDTLSAAMPRP